MEKVKAINHIMMINLKVIPLKCKLWFLLWKVRKNKNKKMDMLFGELLENPYDVEKWLLLFEEEQFMNSTKRNLYISTLQDTFDIEERRALFGESIDGLYSDEDHFFNTLPRTAAGLEKLCAYLEMHMSFAGFRLLFDDQEFGQFLTQETRVEVIRNLCKGPYSLEYLQLELPEVTDTLAMEAAVIAAEGDFLDLDAAFFEHCVDGGL